MNHSTLRDDLRSQPVCVEFSSTNPRSPRGPVTQSSPWHTIASAAQAVHLSPNAIRSYIQQGLLTASRMPSTRKNGNGNPGRGDIRIHNDDLLNFMHDCRIQPNTHTPDPHTETHSQMLQRIMETHPV